MPRVSVIVVNWNGARFLPECLTALSQQTFDNFETIVVDNGSQDDSLAILAQYPAVQIVRSEDNLGFCGGNNLGLQTAKGDLIVLLNNDTKAEPGWLEALVTAADAHPDAGSFASKMLSYHDPSRVDSAGILLRSDAAAFDIGRGEADSAEFDEAREVFGACAGAAMYRRCAIDDVGLFDDRYFAYLEDVDLAVRLQRAGWHCRYVPAARVLHVHGGTSRTLSNFARYQLVRNRCMLLTSLPLSSWVRAGPAVLFGETKFWLTPAARFAKGKRPFATQAFRLEAKARKDALKLLRQRPRNVCRRRPDAASRKRILKFLRDSDNAYLRRKGLRGLPQVFRLGKKSASDSDGRRKGEVR